MHSIVPQLPEELYGEILDHLQHGSDEETFQSCALAGRVLTGPSQRRLFAHITVRHPLKSSTSLRKTGGSALNLKLLLMDSPHLARYVESLQILDVKRTYIVGPGRRQKVDPSTEDEWLSKDEYLPFSLPLLQNLKALIIPYRSPSNGGKWASFSPTLLSCISEVLRLKSFVYLDISQFPILPLMKVAGSNLKHVVIDRLEPVEDPPFLSFPPLPLSGPIFLETLLIKNTHITTFFSSLATEPRIRISELKKLNVHPKTDELVTVSDISVLHSSVAAVLQKCSRTLEEFLLYPTIDVMKIEDSHSFVDPIGSSFSDLLSLRKFHVLLWAASEFGSEEFFSAFPWFISFLRTCSNKHLQEMSISLAYVRGPLEATFQPWKEVADLLLDGRFSALEILHISISTFGRSESDLEELALAPGFRQLRSEGVTVIISFETERKENVSPNCNWERWTDRPGF